MSWIVRIICRRIGDSDANAVDARELHAVLGSRQDFSTWVKSRIEQLGLVAGTDFEVFQESVENPLGGRPRLEYVVSLDAAKHIALAERTDAGRKVRAYFIEAEKRLRDPLALLRDPKVLLGLLEENTRARLALEAENRHLEATVAAQAPKAAIFDRIVECGDTMGFRTAAKLVFEATGAREAEFRTLMMRRGWVQRLDGRLQPAHVGTARGYVSIRDREWTDEDGGQYAKPELRITQKGLTRAIELLLSTEAARPARFSAPGGRA